jgi:DNA polymerase-3 subunit alpha
MVATLNNGGGFYRKELYIHEARMHGAVIHRPCVNNSSALCVIKGKDVWLGLAMVAGLEEDVILKILHERTDFGSFKSLQDFVNRLSVGLEQMRILIRIGAFAFTGKDKKKLLWEVHAMLNAVQPKSTGRELFQRELRPWQLPELQNSDLDDAYDDIELLGFSLCSPFELLKEPLPELVKAADLKLHKNKVIETAGYMISVKYVRTVKGERMYFGTFIDREGLWLDTVHFPPSAKAFPFSGPGTYYLKGKVVEEYDFLSIEVIEMKRLAIQSWE